MSKPELKKRLVTHLNGDKRTQLTYRLFADGKPTEIYQYKATNGRPRYEITQDVWIHGEEEFNALAAQNVGLLDWLHKQVEGGAE